MKLSTNEKLILIPVVVIILNTVLFGVFQDRVLFDSLISRIQSDTTNSAFVVARLVGQTVPVEHVPNVEAMADDDVYAALRKEIRLLAGDLGETRISVIAENGVVVADSELTADELRDVENHSDRAEVVAAKTGKVGHARRFSSTIGVEYLYTAVANGRGGSYISRVSVPLSELYAQRAGARGLIATGGAISIAIVVILAVILIRKLKLASSLEMDRARLEEVVRERTATLTELQDLGSMLAICNDLDDAGKVIAAHVPRLIACEGGAVSLVNASRNLLVVEHKWGEDWVYSDYCAIPDCWALRRSAVHNSSRAGGVLCAHLEPDVQHDVMCIPLIAQGESLGVIHLLMKGAPTAGDTSLNDARVVGEEVAVAILNLQLRETLKQQALKDPLTTLYNRRFLEEHFAYEVARAGRYDNPLTVLMIDVDHFKSFNDTFGHDAGDHVLSQIGKKLRTSVRGEDVVCRLGGEEFAVVLSETGRSGAPELAEKLRVRVEKLEMRFQGRELGEVTISIGVATFPEDGSDLVRILKAGDEALYRAKKAGRNCVVTTWDVTAGMRTS